MDRVAGCEVGYCGGELGLKKFLLETDDPSDPGMRWELLLAMMPLITSSCGGGTDFKSEKSTLILSSEFLSPCLLQTIPSQMKQRWMFSPLFFTWLGGRGNKKVIKNIFTKHSPFCFNLCETVRTETVHFGQFLRRPDLQVKEQSLPISHSWWYSQAWSTYCGDYFAS